MASTFERQVPGEDTQSPEYAAAIEAHNVACRAYKVVRDLYFAGKVSDKDFAQARSVRDAADKVFDSAYTAEQARHSNTQQRHYGQHL